jgi:hypothetical protein
VEEDIARDRLTVSWSKRTILRPGSIREAVMDAPEDDVALVRRWFQRLQLCVQTVDFVGSRPLFADDLITFGTYTAFTIGRDATETEQWRHVWGQIDQFRWRLDDLRTIISDDRLTAAPWRCSSPPATPRTASPLTGLDVPRSCSGGRLLVMSGWLSTAMFRCSPALPRAPLAPGGRRRPPCECPHGTRPEEKAGLAACG